jgi:inhibitor of cysteine peptidase
MKIGTSNKFWKYTKITTILFTAFVVILSGCVDKEQNETEPGNTTNNSQGINGTNNSQGTSGGDYIYGTANVERIQIITLESFPVQIQVTAEGYLPDGCTEIDEIKKEREGNVFNINISTKRPKDAVCTQAIESFTETIPLEVRALKAGNYTVNVNGVTESFELAVDNVPQESPGSMPPRQQAVTEADNGKTINLENGETFYLRLPENPSTGYGWELNLTQGLNSVSEVYYPAEQPEGVEHPLVGAGGVRLWEIKAVAEGSQQVKGIYKRPWENTTGEEDNFTLNVEVA